MRAKVKTTVGEALRGASPVVVTDRMPLVLQHQGHSRTIVGFEKLKSGSVNLLCFDPSKYDYYGCFYENLRQRSLVCGFRKPSAQVRDAAISQYLSSRGDSPYSSTGSGRGKLSRSKFVNRVLHPKQYAENKIPTSSSASASKRRRSEDRPTPDSKRVRGGQHAPDNEVIILDDDSEPEIINASPDTRARDTKLGGGVELDCNKVLETFRLRPKKVGWVHFLTDIQR